MINVPAPPIMAAQRHAHDPRSIGCDPTQSRIPGKKPHNAFFVIAFRNFEPLNTLPQLNRGIVIVDRKFSRVNRVLHVSRRQPYHEPNTFDFSFLAIYGELANVSKDLLKVGFRYP
jgi:hypothetical protein